jgi:hypothetical protein
VLTVGAPVVGEVLAERYRLEAHISNDAYGRQVWRGLDVLLRRPIAVVLRQPGGPSAREMLQAAVLASRIPHPHLVDIYDAIDEGGKAYVVREWVAGLSLRDAVADAPLEPERATTVARAIADAVAAFHAAGLTHGNIHPGTVMLGDDGQVLLTDARFDDEATSDSDVRSVGAVLYAALTGHWPHREAGRANLPDALRESPEAPPVPPRRVRGGIPDHLSDLATDLLDGELPPPSADVLAASLSRLDAEQEEELLDAEEQYGIGGGFLPTSNRTEPRRPVGRKMAVGVALLLVLALVGLLIGAKVLLGDDKPNGGVAPNTSAASGGVAKPGGGATKVLGLKADQVSLVTPNGSYDNDSDVAATVDGNGGTAWKTEHYPNNSTYFTTTKRGIGVLIDLGSAQSVSEVTIDFSNPGATVDIRSGDFGSDHSATGDDKIVKDFTVVCDAAVMGPTHDFLIPPDAAPIRYLLVYITILPLSADKADQYQVGISEIKVSVNQ